MENNFNNNRGGFNNNNNPQVAAKAAVNNNNGCLTNNKLFNKCNNKKVAIGIGASVIGAAIIGGGIYFYKRHQKKAKKAENEGTAAPAKEENA